MSEAADHSPDTRWWGWPPLTRVFSRVIMWPVAIGGVVFLVASVAGLVLGPRGAEAWGQLAGSIFYCAFMLFFARNMLTAVGLDGQQISVRRMLPGLRERVPLDHLDHATVSRGLLNQWLVLYGPGLLPIVLQNTTLGATRVDGWAELLAALRKVLEPLGKWREGEKGLWA